jgi:two-component system, sensor histidine kinase and response regulator
MGGIRITMANKILIIDDDPGIVRVLVEQLTAHGFDTEAANDGEPGYIKACKILPDVILMDVVMPGWNGLYAANRLQSEPSTAKIPIVFMTGLSDDNVSKKYLEQRKYLVLLKPFKVEELLTILSNDLGM